MTEAEKLKSLLEQKKAELNKTKSVEAQKDEQVRKQAEEFRHIEQIFNKR